LSAETALSARTARSRATAIQRTLLVLCWLCLSLAGATRANTLEERVAQGHLSIDSSITPAGDIVPGQKLRLVLKVATDTWFTGGTRIVIPEIPGLVILQNEQFAANASENRGGNTWVVQRWSLDVFPQRPGSFTVGPIKVRVKVNAGSAGNIEGVLESPAVNFSAELPGALQDVEHWVAAPKFSVSQSFDRDLEALAVGDAIEQQVTFNGSDVMAMMLPTYEAPEQPGLAAYMEPPRLDNSINRGELSASRRVSISYMVEAPGDFTLPQREFFWWDTNSGELQLVTLPQTRFSVTGTAAPSKDARERDLAQLLRFAPALAGLVAALLLALLAWRYFPAGRLRPVLGNALATLRELRKPALPRHLNPGSSAGD